MSRLPRNRPTGKKKIFFLKLPYVLQTPYLVAYFKLIPLLAAFLLIKTGAFVRFLLQVLISSATVIWRSLRKIQFKSSRKRDKKKVNLFIYPLSLLPKNARVKILALVVILTFITYSQVIVKMAAQIPSPHQLTSTQRPLTTEIYARDGRLLYQVYEGRNRKLIKLEDLPQDLVNATIAIEDQHFFAHPGIDPLGIIRALSANIKNGQMEGASTITQQLIKNIMLTPEKTYQRKVKEALLAFWAERIYSKQDILQMYFNEAPYGGPTWGIEAASETYFGKSAHNLTLAESAYLAGLPASPTEFSPYGTNPEKGVQRQQEVLRRMVEDGYITPQQSQEALDQSLTFRPPLQEIKAPHFVMYVRSLLASQYGERTVSQGGLKVTTTLDLDIQQMAQAVVGEHVSKLSQMKVGNGAAMVTKSQTGEILAMVGSKDYFDENGGNFNVTLALRQPGSSIKPITYVTAFKSGYTPSTILLDTPTTFPNPWGPSYSPVNYDGRFHGAVTLRTALGSSYNIPAVKMLAVVGIPNMLQTAREMGITTFNKPEDYGLSLTLGGGAVKMLEMMSVYGTLASGGIKHHPLSILKVTDSYGNVLEDHQQVEGEKVLTEEVAYLITHILADNNARAPAFGLNSLLKIAERTVAVKTGTSDDKRDNWTFGYTPEFVVGAWVGNNNNSPMDPKLTSGITGASPIWHDIVSNLTFQRPDIAFEKPKGIIEINSPWGKELAISGQVPKTVVGYKRVKQIDEATGSEREVITYTDPFSVYTPDKTTQ